MNPAVLIAIHRHIKKKKVKKNKKLWIHPILLNRETVGEHLKVEEMRLKYPEKFREYTRLTIEQFDYLIALIGPEIEKQNTYFRNCIPVTTRLIMTLRYLATGNSFSSLATSFSVGKTTAFEIISESTIAMWNVLAPVYLKPPSSEADWKKISTDFYDKWQFPNCLGAIDGKHVIVNAPSNTGSQYYNYKGSFSVVLMATCDANYRFTTIDVGAFGRQSDGGVFSNSGLGQLLESGTVPTGGPRKLPNSAVSLPLFFVGDEAFPLKTYMMRSYPGKDLNDTRRVFNYRLSRARRVIENCFGILSARFRIFRKPIECSPEKVVNIVKGSAALHNFIRSWELDHNQTVSSDHTLSGLGRDVDVDTGIFHNFTKLGSNMHTRVAKDMRDQLAEYFVNEGEVSWQMDAIYGRRS